MSTLKPFENEAQVIEIDGMTIENRLDHISVYGLAKISLDKVGLEIARSLKSIVDDIVASLENRPLPDHVDEAPPPERIPDPWG